MLTDEIPRLLMFSRTPGSTRTPRRKRQPIDQARAPTRRLRCSHSGRHAGTADCSWYCVSLPPEPITPTTEPSDKTIGLPDMPPAIFVFGRLTYFSVKSDRSTLHGFHEAANVRTHASVRASVRRFGRSVGRPSTNASNAAHASNSACPSGSASTATSEIGSTKTHSAQIVGASPSAPSSFLNVRPDVYENVRHG